MANPLEEGANAQPEGGGMLPKGSEGEPPSHGKVDAIHFNVLSFHSAKANGRTIR